MPTTSTHSISSSITFWTRPVERFEANAAARRFYELDSAPLLIAYIRTHVEEFASD